MRLLGWLLFSVALFFCFLLSDVTALPSKWEKVTLPTTDTLYGLHLNKDPKTAIAVGADGTIIRLSE